MTAAQYDPCLHSLFCSRSVYHGRKRRSEEKLYEEPKSPYQEEIRDGWLGQTSTKEIAVLQCEEGKTVWLTNIVKLSHINNISAVMYVLR